MYSRSLGNYGGQAIRTDFHTCGFAVPEKYTVRIIDSRAKNCLIFSGGVIVGVPMFIISVEA